MTIRAKLLIVIPLLVLLADLVAMFLFRSTAVVQTGYDRMMDRTLSYRQSVQSAQSSVQALYRYLTDPSPERRAAYLSLDLELLAQRRQLANVGSPSAEGFGWLLDTLKEQMNAAAAAQATAEAARRYDEVETTLGFIRETGAELVDAELDYDRPIVRRIQRENARLSRLGAAVIAVQTALGAALAYWISRSIAKPVDRLVRAARHVSAGRPADELPDLPISAKDELGILSNAFLQMLADLRIASERDRERLEQSRLVKELELQALQSQIHPHFLFNSLNVLSKLALIEGAERTSDLIVSMSRMIRYILRHPSEPVTLHEELGHVAEYAAIQRARFGSRIRYETCVDESVLNVRLPPLTIQPLVENAFVHGMEGLEGGGKIRLTARADGGDAVVEIADNGAGMDESTLQSLLRMDFEAAEDREGSAGLGTRNVFRRLRLFSGRPDAVALRSEPGRGTTVTVRLSLSKEEGNEDVPTADRG